VIVRRALAFVGFGLKGCGALVVVLGLALTPTLAGCHREPNAGGLVVVNPFGDRPTFFDFGKVRFGEPIEHVFRIRNDDPVPVTVRDLLPSCSCSRPSISYVAKDGSVVQGDPSSRERVITLPSGATAELVVKVDTERVERMNIDKLTQVRLRSDSATTPYLTFEMHLVVARAMLSVPSAIELGQTPQSIGKSGRADVMVDLLSTKYRVLGIESIEGPFTATVDETVVANVPTWIVVAAAKPGLQLGPTTGVVFLSVSGEDGTGTSPPFKLPVSAQISPDVVARPPVLAFGTIARGKPAEVDADVVALVPGETVRVTGTKVSTIPAGAAAAITAEAVAPEPGDDGRASTWRIRLVASEALSEAEFSGMLVIETDHPRVPEVRVPFSGTMR
jgi:hypothetical protein